MQHLEVWVKLIKPDYIGAAFQCEGWPSSVRGDLPVLEATCWSDMGFPAARLRLVSTNEWLENSSTNAKIIDESRGNYM